jgi:predicted Rossmann fold flavoprotein
MIYDAAIIGGGAAGLMAAVFAGRAGTKVCVIERNTALGRKLLKTGRGRCNLTHQASVEELVRTFDDCGKFLKHALYTFSPEAVIQFFADHRLTCKVEKDGCVYPITDRATDVCRILQDDARRHNVHYIYGRRVEAVEKQGDVFALRTADQTLSAKTVIVATGGLSWPQTAATATASALLHPSATPSFRPAPRSVPLSSPKAGSGICRVSRLNRSSSAPNATIKKSPLKAR